MPGPIAIALYAAGVSLAYILRSTIVLFPLLRSEAHTSLSFPSTEFSGLRYWSLFVYFIIRSLVRRIPLFSPLAIPENEKDDTSVIPGPRISLELPFQSSAADIRRYARAAKTIDTDVYTSPLHLMLFLSAATEPAMLLLLSKSICLVDPVGSVNVRNRFEITNPGLLDQKLKGASISSQYQGSAKDQGWKLVARLDPKVAKVKKGWEVVIIIELVTTSGRVLYRQFFTFLQFAKHKFPVTTENTQSPKVTGVKQVGTVKMVDNDPGLWAGLSKDYNPIHFSALLARMFGFKGKIAHGNHVLAKGLARLPEGVEVKGVTTMEVEFRRPVFVPSELDIGLSAEGSREEGREITLGRDGKEHTIAQWR
jgi:acyl dehydratase